MNSGNPSAPVKGPIVLNQQQSAQLMERLKQQNKQLQTTINPQTGEKRIYISATSDNKKLVAIPLQPSSSAVVSAAPNITLSPIKLHGASALAALPQQARTIKIGSPRPQVVTNGQHQIIQKTQATSQLVFTQQAAMVTPNKPGSLLTATQASTFSSPSSQQVENLANRSSSKRAAEIDFETFSDSKRRKTDKDRKGLRHFSMKVCEKVKAKGFTSYNEVAEELVAELTDPRCNSPSDDQKNIKRRVYDALNVLMAMNIISKEKKEIRWLGLPTNSVQEAYSLESEKSKRIDRIKDKTRQLQDLIIQQIAFKNLVERNQEQEQRSGEPTPNSSIQLPFIIVSTKNGTVVDVQISEDKSEWLFDFTDVFEINDDMEVLRRMDMDLGLERGQVTEEDLEKAKSMVPKALEPYVVQLAQHGKGVCSMPRVSEPMPHLNIKEDPGDDDDLDED